MVWIVVNRDWQSKPLFIGHHSSMLLRATRQKSTSWRRGQHKRLKRVVIWTVELVMTLGNQITRRKIACPRRLKRRRKRLQVNRRGSRHQIFGAVLTLIQFSRPYRTWLVSTEAGETGTQLFLEIKSTSSRVVKKIWSLITVYIWLGIRLASIQPDRFITLIVYRAILLLLLVYGLYQTYLTCYSRWIYGLLLVVAF